MIKNIQLLLSFVLLFSDIAFPRGLQRASSKVLITDRHMLTQDENGNPSQFTICLSQILFTGVRLKGCF